MLCYKFTHKLRNKDLTDTELEFPLHLEVERLKGSVQKAEREALEFDSQFRLWFGSCACCAAAFLRWKAAAEQRAQEVTHHLYDNLNLQFIVSEHSILSHLSVSGERSPGGPGQEGHLGTRQEERGSHPGSGESGRCTTRRWPNGAQSEAKKSTDEAIKKLEDAKKQLAEALETS